MDDDNNVTTRLLTLLNVSALKTSKRKRTDDLEPSDKKLNKRSRSVQFSDVQTLSVEVQKDNVDNISQPVEQVEETPQTITDGDDLDRMSYCLCSIHSN
jgi:U3 small nucleolar RNA-associated protein 25